MMKRLFPAPLISFSLWVFWIFLQGPITLGSVLMGFIAAVALPLMVRSLRPMPVRVRNFLAIFRLIAAVGHDVVKSNFEVGWGVIRMGRRPPHGAFVRIPLDLQDTHGLAALAMITTVVPGTVWSELAVDRSSMLLHVWDVDDEEAFVHFFKARYELPLREIFE